MEIESAININKDSTHSPFTMEVGGFGSGKINNVSLSNSEVGVTNSSHSSRGANRGKSSSHHSDTGSRRADVAMETSSVSTSGESGKGRSTKRKCSIDPFDMFVQLKRQNQKLQQHLGDNSGSMHSKSYSPHSSFHRMNTIGSFASIGSMSKLSASDMSLVMSSAQAPANGKNNQAWNNFNNMGSMKDRMHSSLPAMDASNMGFGRNSNQSMGNLAAGRNMKFNASNIPNFGNNRPSNEFMSAMAEEVGSSYFSAGNPFQNNGGHRNSFSGGFGVGANDAMSGSSGAPIDFSKLSDEQLRQMVMMEALEKSAGSRNNSIHSDTSLRATNKSNANPDSSNPFLKNLGLMDYRNHVLPMTIERHSSKAKRSSFSSHNSMGDAAQMTAPVSDHASSAGHNSMTDFNTSSSNFSFHSDSMAQEEYGTMPDEKESYNAAANGILAPWSARAAGLFGDMMVQSTEDEKAKKASRKKPKDKPKRPLSAYNIFFKEERNRILKARDAATNSEARASEVPSAIEVSEGFDTNASDRDASNKSCESFTDGADEKDESLHKNSQGSQGRIGFESLAKLIGRRWQELDDASMAVYKSKASVDMERYKKEMEVWDAKHGITSSRKRSTKGGKGVNSTKKTKRPPSPVTEEDHNGII